MAATKLGRSAAISPILRDDTPKASAPAAFPEAMPNRRIEALSWRWNAIAWPPGSSTAALSGLSLRPAPLAKAASMMRLAWFRLMRFICPPRFCPVRLLHSAALPSGAPAAGPPRQFAQGPAGEAFPFRSAGGGGFAHASLHRADDGAGPINA